MKTVQNILVPTDFSDLSLAAIEMAKTIAELFNAKIYFLNVIDDEPSLAFRIVDSHSETVLRDAEAKAQNILAHLSDEYFKNCAEIKIAVQRGNPFKSIIQFIEENEIDLVVMATHGHTGLAHVLLGSVAEKVVRYSTVPVLTIKPKEMHRKFLHDSSETEQLHLN